MKKPQIRTVPYRRKRQFKTNYKRRIYLLKSGKTRLVVRKTLKNILGQIVAFDIKGDKVLVSANSRELLKLGWKYSRNNLSASYLTGYLLGTKALSKNIKEGVLDLGLQPLIKGGKLFSFLKGVVDAGVNVPFNEKVFPSEERVKGAHIAEYAGKIKESGSTNNQFSKYHKDNVKAEDMPKVFEDVKSKIKGVK